MKRIAIIGAGSWGTALARLVANKGHDVLMWAFEPETALAINREHRNDAFLPGIPLPERVRATGDLTEAVADREIVVSVVPSHVLRGVWTLLAPHIAPSALIVSCTKGIEIERLTLMSQVLSECLPDHPAANRTVLSGPSFAQEVAADLPASVVIAGSDAAVCRQIQELFRTDRFLTFTADDVIGVEVGGAVKNVIAITAGVADGLALGHSARAAIITRGLYEMIKVGRLLGASPLTFAGLSGIGDLVLTCTARLSRNYAVGFELGKGRQLPEILASMRSVAEGIPTAKAVNRLTKDRGVFVPICSAMHRILSEGLAPSEALAELCTMELGDELRQLKLDPLSRIG